MAEENDGAERTEDPTQKRLDEALKRGDVAKSQEVNTWFVLGGGTLGLLCFSAARWRADLSTTLAGSSANAHQLPVDGRAPRRSHAELAFDVVAAIGAAAPLLILAALAGNVMQHRLVWSVEPLDAEALHDLAARRAAKRLFCKQAPGQFRQGPRQDRVCRRGDDLGCSGRSATGSTRWSSSIRRPLLPFDASASRSSSWRRSLPCSRSSRRGIASISARPGTSASTCRCRSSRKSSSRPKAIPRSRPSSGNCARSACASA